MSASLTIAQTRITEESHWRFAAFSGDLNPIHEDPAAAKLMEPGGLLAYGMDMVLWALESLAAQELLSPSLARLRARFVRWVYLEDDVSLRASASSREGLQAFELLVNDEPVATLELFSGERASSPTVQDALAAPTKRTVARELALDEMHGVEGTAALSASHQAEALYPRLAQRLGPAAVSELAACSYIIGMEAPGLYSMSMRYDLHLTDSMPGNDSTGLHFQVAAVDDRFRKVKIAVTGTHLRGTLEALVRSA